MPVFACDLEISYGLAVHGEAFGVIEPNAHGDGAVGLQFGGGLLVQRARVADIFTVGHIARSESEAGADGLLVWRVHVVGEADVE
jgi:hypothetical protein